MGPYREDEASILRHEVDDLKKKLRLARAGGQLKTGVGYGIGTGLAGAATFVVVVLVRWLFTEPSSPTEQQRIEAATRVAGQYARSIFGQRVSGVSCGIEGTDLNINMPRDCIAVIDGISYSLVCSGEPQPHNSGCGKLTRR